MKARRLHVALVLFAGLALAACGGDRSGPRATATEQAQAAASGTPLATNMPPTALSRDIELANARSHLYTPTYDGTDQAVHPDIVYFAGGWHGFAYWMAMTPFPFDTDTRENPSVLASNDGLSWVVPPGVVNPLVAAPSCDHNSDPDIVYSPRTDELLLYYTEVRRSSRCGPDVNENHVKLIRSRDGVHWTRPKTVMTFDLDAAPLYLSPAVVYRNGVFHMWMPSNADSLVYATSSDGVAWSPLRAARMTPSPWHVDVAYVEASGAYWMLFVDGLRPGSRLRFATSRDGLQWNACDSPMLAPGMGWDNERIYRATFVRDETGDLLRVWYSARSADGEWHIGYTEGASGVSGVRC